MSMIVGRSASRTNPRQNQTHMMMMMIPACKRLRETNNGSRNVPPPRTPPPPVPHSLFTTRIRVRDYFDRKRMMRSNKSCVGFFAPACELRRQRQRACLHTTAFRFVCTQTSARSHHHVHTNTMRARIVRMQRACVIIERSPPRVRCAACAARAQRSVRRCSFRPSLRITSGPVPYCIHRVNCAQRVRMQGDQHTPHLSTSVRVTVLADVKCRRTGSIRVLALGSDFFFAAATSFFPSSSSQVVGRGRPHRRFHRRNVFAPSWFISARRRRRRRLEVGRSRQPGRRCCWLKPRRSVFVFLYVVAVAAVVCGAKPHRRHRVYSNSRGANVSVNRRES